MNTKHYIDSQSSLNRALNNQASNAHESKSSAFTLFNAIFNQLCHEPIRALQDFDGAQESVQEDRALKSIELNTHKWIDLETHHHHISSAKLINEALNKAQIASFRLGINAYRHPLSLYNDQNLIGDEVIENCPVRTQAALREQHLLMHTNLQTNLKPSSEENAETEHDYKNVDRENMQFKDFEKVIASSQSYEF